VIRVAPVPVTWEFGELFSIWRKRVRKGCWCTIIAGQVVPVAGIWK
jgi:hypothetical protein